MIRLKNGLNGNKNIKIDPKYLERDPNKQYVACISYGKDSLAMLEVIKNYVFDGLIYKFNTNVCLHFKKVVPNGNTSLKLQQ